MLVLDTGAFGTKYRIAVSDFQFTPKNLTNVKLGDTIRWYWVSGTHTTTSTGIPAGAIAWDQPMSISDTAFEYVPAVVGLYDYKCTPHAAFGMIGSITVVSTSGIPDPVSKMSYIIYPNPVHSNLFIHTEKNTGLIKGIRIFDPAGRLVKETSLAAGFANGDRTVDLSDLPSGIYLLEFTDDHNIRYSDKINKL
jgi:plastocyanin